MSGNYKNKNWVEQKYLVEKLSSAQIANLENVHPTTIKRWMKKHQISARSTIEGRLVRFGIVELQNVVLTEEEEQILYGSLFGDGCISMLNKYNANGYYVETHSLDQEQYLRWKAKKLKRFVRDVKPYRYFRKDDNKECEAIRLDTHWLPVFTELYSKFYPDGTKRVTLENLNKLQALGLAVWHMDDGFYDQNYSKSITFFTEGFTAQDNELIQQYFLSQWSLKFLKTPSKGGCNISLRLNSREARKFIEIIEDFVPKCMWYKIGR